MLLAAQERLEYLRSKTLAGRDERNALGSVSGRPAVMAAVTKVAAAEHGQQILDERRRREAIAQGLAASDTLSAYLKTEPLRIRRPPQPEPKAKGRSERDALNIRRSSSPKEELVKVYPSLAQAMLQTELAAPGRVYWLLKHLDPQGRGWLSVDDIRFHLTNKQSSLRVCGWRRLRQLLTQGEDLFWTRDGVGRLWINGPAKVAQELGCYRFKGKPIGLPLAVLLGGIKEVRAHFYASFHSGRHTNNPISREALRELTGVAERTQQVYDQAAKIDQQRNMAVGEKYKKIFAEERAWQQGRGVFRFIDSKGYQGRKGQEYLAWHLPNSYHGPHEKRCKGRQKKINRQLRDLVMKGMRGNGRDAVEQLFWANGAAAGGAYNRNPKSDAYWPHGRGRESQYILWGVVPGERR